MADKAAFDAFMKKIDKEAKAKADSWLATEKKKQRDKNTKNKKKKGTYSYPGLGGKSGGKSGQVLR